MNGKEDARQTINTKAKSTASAGVRWLIKAGHDGLDGRRLERGCRPRIDPELLHQAEEILRSHRANER